MDINEELDEIAFRSYASYVEGKLLVSSLNLDKLVDLSTDMVVELTRVEMGCLMLFSEKTRELSIEACKGLKHKKIRKKAIIKTKNDVIKWIVEWKKPILLSELDKSGIKECFRTISEEIGYGIVLSVPLVAKGKLIGLFNLGEKESGKPFYKQDLQMLSTISGSITIAVENAKLYENLHKSYFSTVSALAEAIETKDPYTRGHSERVSRYAVVIAGAMNLPPFEIEGIRVAGILHDVGKIGLQEGILLKFAPLTDAEFNVIKEHPVVSARIIDRAEFPWEVKLLARHHHERYDGSGYPDKLKGEEIPLGARVLAVADTYEALMADRPYRRGFPKEKALKIIKEVTGTQLDPEIVKVFLNLAEKEEI